ncbi:Omp28-related outer membrane protein [Aequorivita sp. F47161]|uniref:Omp28-related outer membrane protein n=1 Tax=Aequorivita vitellina TaxID=2874475 RepID=A0A9X1QSS9_9FLAO|nr:Omp28-related outer membrane protein [Aequorivita vitellina]MCG2418193.1 Omp28-related outer membrane protein [Aequorivita vitellina]MCZ4318078.1 Omp28-related outer membrane protein [Aequorivita viscosa]
MKTNPYLKALLFFAIITIVSCSKKEDPYVEPSPLLTLELKSDAGTGELVVLRANDSVNFTVIGSDGVDYTSASQIFVNNVEIAGDYYIFEELGEFTVDAIYNDVSSNSLNFEVLAPTERALTIDFPKALRNQTITFGLLDSQGNNTASDATFYVDDTAISGFTYSSATEGSFVVYAEYEVDNELHTTASKTFEVFIPKRKVVIEDYTGTWCGFCPAVALAIDTAKVATNHISVVAIHETGASLPDPMHFERVQDLKDAFGIGGLPQARLNRKQKWLDPYNVNDVLAMAGAETDLAIAIDSKVTGANLTVDVKVVYASGSVTGDKIVVYLVESGIIYAQANYFNATSGHPLEGHGNPIPDFVHNDALRNSLTDIFGDAITETPAYTEYKKQYNLEIPSEYNVDNLSVVVMVVDSDNNAKNSQHAEVGENKTFE